MTPDEKSGVISCREPRRANCRRVAIVGSRVELVWSGRVGPGAKLSYMLLVGSRVKHVWSSRGGSLAFLCRVGPGTKNRAGKNPTQHGYHITARSLRQWQNRPPSGKSVFSTKANVRIWGTFRLEKFGFPCYLIVTKRNRKTPIPLVDYQK